MIGSVGPTLRSRTPPMVGCSPTGTVPAVRGSRLVGSGNRRSPDRPRCGWSIRSTARCSCSSLLSRPSPGLMPSTSSACGATRPSTGHPSQPADDRRGAPGDRGRDRAGGHGHRCAPVQHRHQSAEPAEPRGAGCARRERPPLRSGSRWRRRSGDLAAVGTAGAEPDDDQMVTRPLACPGDRGGGHGAVRGDGRGARSARR